MVLLNLKDYIVNYPFFFLVKCSTANSNGDYYMRKVPMNNTKALMNGWVWYHVDNKIRLD